MFINLESYFSGMFRYNRIVCMCRMYPQAGADLRFLEWWGCKYKRTRSARKNLSHAHLIKTTPI